MPKRKFFSTFITGFDTIVEKAIKNSLPDASIETLLDGLVVYSTASSTDQIKQLRFFNNSYFLLESINFQEEQKVKSFIKHIIKHTNFKGKLKNHPGIKNKSFRIILSVENQFTPIDQNLLKSLENKIQSELDLTVNRSRPGIEFWFLIRRNGLDLFGLRLTKHPNYTKSLPKGELRPELAHLLCLMSEPDEGDIFLDPFAGHGSVPIERAISFPYKKIIASDIDSGAISNLKARTKTLNLDIQIKNRDALSLEKLADESVDKIVTDPPWGHFLGKELDLEQFYTQMLSSFHRVLKDKGIVVITIEKKELLEKIIAGFTGKFQLKQKTNTLVSGRKAGVYKLTKT